MILFSLLIGYIAFARFLTYQLIWVVLVLMTFYFMVLFTTDLCAALFSPQTVSGKMLKKRSASGSPFGTDVDHHYCVGQMFPVAVDDCRVVQRLVRQHHAGLADGKSSPS